MKITKVSSCLLVVQLLIFCASKQSIAAKVQVNNPSQFHFIDFNNDPPAHPTPNFISSNEVPEGSNNFGWHNRTMNTYPRLAGVILDKAYAVCEIRFQVHHNPFRDFILQGSNDTADGFDGNWTDIYTSTIEATLEDEYKWEPHPFQNNVPYIAYRIKMLNDDGNSVGFGMYRWRLLVNDCSDSLCYIQMSQDVYNVGDTVTAEVLKLGNPSPDPIRIELKIWLKPPGLPPISVANNGALGNLEFPAGFCQDFGPIDLFPLATFPIGLYEFSVRMLDPVTGELLCEDLNSFTIE